MSPEDKICSSLETPQTLHADSVTSTTDDMILAPLWGDRVQAPRPYNYGPSWLTLPCTELWSQVQAGDCFLVFNLRAENRREGLSNRRGTQSCAVSTIGQGRCSPCLVLSCPIHALAGQVEGGNVSQCVSEWDQSHEFTANPCVLESLTMRERGMGSLWNLCLALYDQSHWASQSCQKASAHSLGPTDSGLVCHFYQVICQHSECLLVVCVSVTHIFISAIEWGNAPLSFFNLKQQEEEKRICSKMKSVSFSSQPKWCECWKISNVCSFLIGKRIRIILFEVIQHCILYLKIQWDVPWAKLWFEC